MSKAMELSDVELLRLAAFCTALEIKPATGRMWILQRRVDVVRVGRAVRIPKSEVARILSEGFTPRLQRTA